MQEIEGKIAHLSVERPEKLTQIARALSSPLRIEVLFIATVWEIRQITKCFLWTSKNSY